MPNKSAIIPNANSAASTDISLKNEPEAFLLKY